GQALDLFGSLDIARKQDEPPRLAFAQKRTLSRGENRTGNSGDESPCRHHGGLAGACRKSSKLSCLEPYTDRRRPCNWRRTELPHAPMRRVPPWSGRRRPCCPNPRAG